MYFKEIYTVSLIILIIILLIIQYNNIYIYSIKRYNKIGIR